MRLRRPRPRDDGAADAPRLEKETVLAEEGGLPELLEGLRWRWKLIVLITVGVFAGAAFYVQGLPSIYEGEAVVAIAPVPNKGAGADTLRFIAPAYVEYVTAPSTIAEVAPGIGEDPGEVDKGLDANVAIDTGNLTITSRMPTPEQAARVANAFAEEAVAFSLTDDLHEAAVIAEALPPSAPAAPPRKLLQAAALMVGLVLALGISFLVERGRPRLRSWRDITKLTGYPVIGRIPSSRVLKNHPMDAFADPRVGSAFRTLRTNLEREWRDRTVHVIMVTSPNPGDGKTTVTALFAESLARLGSRVLLIDADLRRPGLARSFRMDDALGLAQVLRGQKTLSEAVQRGWVDNLSVLTTTTDPDAGDLLARNFDDIISQARHLYEVIVIDTPPLLGTDDARTIATLTDGVIVVISAGSNAAPVNEAVIALEGLRAPVLGAVGNRLWDASKSYYYS